MKRELCVPAMTVVSTKGIIHREWCNGCAAPPQLFQLKLEGKAIACVAALQGNETRLQHCQHKPWGYSNCLSTEAVFITCAETPDTATSLNVDPPDFTGKHKHKN